ncbi:hypothetical protein A9Q91_03145 [Candidatus Gracilibacteria bacterium 28_42_T64]|nr:hypothetical protein A9Q91_03145 [Candidatus Gracilibacteria bacterium 28_42_T64]
MNSAINSSPVENEILKTQTLLEKFPNEVNEFLEDIRGYLKLEKGFDFSSITFDPDIDICEDGISLELKESGKKKLIKLLTYRAFEKELVNEGGIDDIKLSKVIFHIERAQQALDISENAKNKKLNDIKTLIGELDGKGIDKSEVQEEINSLNEDFIDLNNDCIITNNTLENKKNKKNDYLKKTDFFKSFSSNFIGYILFSEGSTCINTVRMLEEDTEIITDKEVEKNKIEEKNVQKYISILNLFLQTSYSDSKKTVSLIKPFELSVQEKVSGITYSDVNSSIDNRTIGISQKINDFIEKNKKMARIILFSCIGIASNYMIYSDPNTKDIPYNTADYKDQSFLKAQVEKFMKDSIADSGSMHAIGYHFKQNFTKSKLYSPSSLSSYGYEVVSSDNEGIEISFTEKGYNKVFFTYKYLFNTDEKEHIQEGADKVLKNRLNFLIDESISIAVKELGFNLNSLGVEELLKNKILDGIDNKDLSPDFKLDVSVDMVENQEESLINIKITSIVRPEFLIEYQKNPPVENIYKKYMDPRLSGFEKMVIENLPSFNTINTVVYERLFESYLENHLLKFLRLNSKKYDRYISSVEIKSLKYKNQSLHYELFFTYEDRSVDKKPQLRVIPLDELYFPMWINGKLMDMIYSSIKRTTPENISQDLLNRFFILLRRDLPEDKYSLLLKNEGNIYTFTFKNKAGLTIYEIDQDIRLGGASNIVSCNLCKIQNKFLESMNHIYENGNLANLDLIKFKISTDIRGLLDTFGGDYQEGKYDDREIIVGIPDLYSGKTPIYSLFLPILSKNGFKMEDFYYSPTE